MRNVVDSRAGSIHQHCFSSARSWFSANLPWVGAEHSAGSLAVYVTKQSAKKHGKGRGEKKCQQCVFPTSAGEQLEWVRSTLWLPQLLLCSSNRIENTLGKMQARDSHAVTLAQHIFQPGTAQGFPEVVCSYLIASYRSRYTPIITHLLLHKCLEDPTSS